ncbi:hypothetical protein RND71_014510 [Anisodus tanguticus]|uniref:Uncharacterized protein n=1 Tax=Anisodus tanguticus TaxID=243964 RepID=A0AAE1SAS0_9SOLA|nr:hypothetical protein RND71_014510 [Anisodus tanguticus]
MPMELVPVHQRKKMLSVSMGTVSSMIPRYYVTNMPLITETSTSIKPLELSANDLFTPKLKDERTTLGDATTSKTLPTSVKEFLLKMLKSGFSLDMSVINDVENER